MTRRDENQAFLARRVGSRSRAFISGVVGLWRACQEDLAYALKSLRQAWKLALVVIGSLVVGVGVNAGVLKVAEAVLFKPLPYAQADRVVCIGGASGQSFITYKGNGFELTSRTWNSSKTFAVVGAYSLGGLSVTEQPAERVPAAAVTARFFSAVGVPMQLGRAFDDASLQLDSRLAIISDALWRRRYAAAPRAVGSTLHLNGIPFTIVGITASGAEFPLATEVWISSSQGDELGDMASGARVVARLSASATPAHARDEATRIEDELPSLTSYPPGGKSVRGGTGRPPQPVQVVPLREEIVGRVRPILLLVVACASLVLVVGGVNACNLLLSRVYARGHQHAIHRALGASRWRIARHVYFEAVLLAIAAGAASIPIVYWTSRLAGAALPHGLTESLGSGMGTWTIAGAGCLALFAGLVVGILPALSSAGIQQGTFAGSGTRDAWRRLRGALVVTQLSCALVALVVAVALARTVAQLTNVDLGARRDSALTFKITLPSASYPPGPRIPVAYERFEATLRGIAGVKAVGATDQLPGDVQQMLRVTGIRPAGTHSRNQGRTGLALRLHATPRYFAATGIPLLAGRVFDSSDALGTPPVIIVSRGYATAIGLRAAEVVGLRQNVGSSSEPVLAEIVGVVEDVRLRGPESRPETSVYIPFAQETFLTNVLHVAIDTDRERTDCVAAVREAARQFDPTVPLGNPRTLGEIRASYVRDRHLAMLVTSVFAGLVAVLAAIGVYAAIGFLVLRMTREIGIRFALGATTRSICAYVLAIGLRYGVAAVALGGLGSWAVMKVVAARVAGVQSLEPMSFGVAGASVLFLAGLAAWLPARRATLVDPCKTLRSE